MPNLCKEQTCDKQLPRKDHFLCRIHWDMNTKGAINKCPECGVYKDSGYELCIKCNKKKKVRSIRQTKTTPTEKRAKPRRYDSEKAETFSERAAFIEDDPKAKDKRLLFDEQKHKCVYCGHQYRYDELQMEHMIPKTLGGPDNIRNCQLACSSCNKAKGTMTDIQFRKKHAKHLPQKERQPADPPIDPALLTAPVKKARSFFDKFKLRK